MQSQPSNLIVILIRPLTRSINTQIAIPSHTKVLEQKATLEVLVRVEDCVELVRVPEVFIFDLFIALVGRLGWDLRLFRGELTFLISDLWVDSNTLLHAMW